MSVFEEYKKQFIDKNDNKKQSKEDVKRVWEKNEDGSISLTQNLNDEMVKSFFSSAKRAFVGIVAESIEEDITEEEKNIEEIYEMRVAQHEANNFSNNLIDLNKYFQDEVNFSEDNFDAFDYDDEGNMTKGISARRFEQNGQSFIDVWVFNKDVEEEARFVDTEYEEIMEWIKSIF